MKIRIICLTLTLIFGGCATSNQCKVAPPKTIAAFSVYKVTQDNKVINHSIINKHNEVMPALFHTLN